MIMNAMKDLSDGQLIERIEAMAASCERIMNMSIEVRQKPSPKGSSPEQCGIVQALLVSAFWAEAQRRGLALEAL